MIIAFLADASHLIILVWSSGYEDEVSIHVQHEFGEV